MIDLHVHILPGVDDGSADMSESLEMAQLAYESGVNRLVATPHSNQVGRFENYYSEELQAVYQEFCKALREEHISLRVDLGMEIFASEDMQDKIVEKDLIGLHRSSTYLVEFPFDADPGWIGEQLEDILDLGKRPLIAHPERYYCVQDYPGVVYEWLQLGCLTQMNRGSALGRFGKRVHKASEILLAHDLITCIASDAHSAYVRTTYMEDIWNHIEEIFGEGAAHRLLEENPQRILEDRKIPVHGMKPERRRKLFW